MSNTHTIYTIGHSTRSIESFLGVLTQYSISAVADVRSSPYSRHVPHFSREALKHELSEIGIAYVFLGDALGARSKDHNCYVNNVVSYELLAKTSVFKQGIERVIEGSKRYRVALMCSERDPTECHRTILVSKALTEGSISVGHILDNNKLETHEETMLRVVDLLGMPRTDLLRSSEEVLEEAYRGRERQIAYRREG